MKIDVAFTRDFMQTYHRMNITSPGWGVNNDEQHQCWARVQVIGDKAVFMVAQLYDGDCYTGLSIVNGRHYYQRAIINILIDEGVLSVKNSRQISDYFKDNKEIDDYISNSIRDFLDQNATFIYHFPEAIAPRNEPNFLAKSSFHNCIFGSVDVEALSSQGFDLSIPDKNLLIDEVTATK